MSEEKNTDARFKLNLFENSISFIQEAIEKAKNAQSSHRDWKFATLHATHSIELSLKEILRREHPFFVYENIDNPRYTVGIDTAVKRLESLLKRPLSKNDIAMIKEAQTLRNEIIHFEVDFSIEKIRILFAQLVGFLNYLHESYLDHALIENLPGDQYDFILQNQSFARELESRAYQRMEDEGISKEDALICPHCFTETFVVGANSKGICYICHVEDLVEECAGCKNYFAESELKDFSDEFEYSNEGSLYSLENDYGYRNHQACPDCIDSIKEDIRDQRMEEENDSMEMDYYYSKK